MRKTLIIIPCTKPQYNIGFSAPISWMFSKHSDLVHGIFSFELNNELVSHYEYFIIELNWFTELYEFVQIVKIIKERNKKAKILFGGLYSQLTYKKIFKNFDVDYFIKGDNELPVTMFLEGESVHNIANFVSKSFENKIEYIFRQDDYKKLEFNLDWFSNYQYYLGLNKKNDHDEKTYRNPLVITAKSGCTTVHEGCDYCMGSRANVLKKLYHRETLEMDNDSLINILSKLEKKYNKYCIYFISKYQYDFTNLHFNSEVTIEVDSKINIEQIQKLMYAFRKCKLMIPLHREGIMGKQIIDNYNEILKLETENHRILFFIYQTEYDSLKNKIPSKNLIVNLDKVFSPEWAHYDSYKNFNIAIEHSKEIWNLNKKNFVNYYSIAMNR